MGGVCPARSHSRSPAPAVKPHKEAAAGDAKAAPAARPLPVQSWCELLKEPPLNAEAKPFRPQPGVAPPPGLSLPSVPMANCASTAPKLERYLSKRLEASDSKAVTGATGPSLQSKLEKKERHSMGRFPRNAPTLQNGLVSDKEGRGGGGMATFQTSEYLRMLKEPKAKQPGAASVKKKRMLASYANTLGSDVGPGELEESGQGLPATIVTRASFALRSPCQGFNPEESMEEKLAQATQDDLWVEKWNRDYDLADPAYWSEVESVSNRYILDNVSSHRLGHRPKQLDTRKRSYVMQDLSLDIDKAVAKLLFRCQRYSDQQRAFSEVARLGHRRFIIGLKEVARRVKQSKMICMIIAPDIEEDSETGGLDDRMRELLVFAYKTEIPVIFALSRGRLGRALGKSVNISVLGILDCTGASSLMGNAVELARLARQSWLARISNQESNADAIRIGS